ncbi:hypothetical protein [Streptomyces sp. TRM70350]|uniref:hypothetical protein n=1 Tax=Streptomyces sp. TRM70350 TaxID=2856165 RepID=UPI001C4491BD|nr:hypothetical protein [Streptomyces sp. TRM70350]
MDTGEPPVYVGFGSMATHPPKDIAQVATGASRAHGRRVLLARGSADLAPIDDADDCFVGGEVNQQAGWASARLAAARRRPSASCPPRSQRP